jgi:hypothetical protein
MQRDDLMPQHICARLQRRRNRDAPRVVAGYQVVDRPVPRRRPVVQADLVDFGEFERRLVDGRAVVVGAGGQVVEDGAAVAGRPGVPEELDGLAGDDGDVRFAGFAGFVADDVGGGVGVGGDLGDWMVASVGLITPHSKMYIDPGTYETRVESCCRPAGYGWRVGLVVVVEVPAGVELAAGLDQVDEAVGRCSRE